MEKTEAKVIKHDTEIINLKECVRDIKKILDDGFEKINKSMTDKETKLETKIEKNKTNITKLFYWKAGLTAAGGVILFLITYFGSQLTQVLANLITLT